jgi:hypothetical protein
MEGMTKRMIVKMTFEQVLPFVLQYNRWSGTQVADPEEAVKCVWCGIQIKGVVRAVLGLQAVDFETTFVWGMFGDGSGSIDERIAGVYLMQVVNALPYKLEGAILPANVDQQRRALKNGWAKTDRMVMCGTNNELQELWERPFPGQGKV